MGKYSDNQCIVDWDQKIAIFSHVLVCYENIVWPKYFKLLKDTYVVESMILFCVRKRYAWLDTVCDLKTVRMNVQCSLIWEFII